MRSGFSRSGITCFALAIVLSAWFVARRQTTRSKRAVAGAYLAFLLAIVLLIREIRRRFREGRDDTMTYWVRAGAVTGLVAR